MTIGVFLLLLCVLGVAVRIAATPGDTSRKPEPARCVCVRCGLRYKRKRPGDSCRCGGLLVHLKDDDLDEDGPWADIGGEVDE